VNVLTIAMRNTPAPAEYPVQTMTATAPILLFGSYGELDVYASVADAERAIDPWALSDGALSAADASGRVLRELSVGHSVHLTDTGASEPEQVRARLAERLHEDGELARLVERAIERFGYRR
jgi:hypothetical protein